jgi:hypothetical protein
MSFLDDKDIIETHWCISEDVENLEYEQEAHCLNNLSVMSTHLGVK